MGPIVGGAVGGIAALTLIAAAFFLVRRRRRGVKPQTPAQYAKREADLWSGSSVSQSEGMNALLAPHGSPSPPKSSQ